MARMIDGNKLIERFKKAEHDPLWHYTGVIAEIAFEMDQGGIDVVPCKDCKYWNYNTFGHVCKLTDAYTSSKHYCSAGEQKKED